MEIQGKIKMKKEKQRKPFECGGCKFFDDKKKQCIDKKVFVNKYDTMEIVCRYNKNAININEV